MKGSVHFTNFQNDIKELVSEFTIDKNVFVERKKLLKDLNKLNTELKNVTNDFEKGEELIKKLSKKLNDNKNDSGRRKLLNKKLQNLVIEFEKKDVERGKLFIDELDKLDTEFENNINDFGRRKQLIGNAARNIKNFLDQNPKTVINPDTAKNPPTTENSDANNNNTPALEAENLQGRSEEQ
uniref:Uncharacterized protein n=1 Tax=Rhabditophanes sp. KR3021 TaxID=114890 RepID=A0AC35TPC2_9BILA